MLRILESFSFQTPSLRAFAQQPTLPWEWVRYCRRAWILALAVFFGQHASATVGQSLEGGEPRLVSIFPFVAERGSQPDIEVRGNWLDGVSAVWCDEDGMKGQVIAVEAIDDAVKPKVNPLEKPQKPVQLYRAQIRLQIEKQARPGDYSLRLVSARGISNPIRLQVVDGGLVLEKQVSQAALDSTALKLPAIVCGKIAEPGDVDVYTFHASKGQRFRFESMKGADVPGGKFAVELGVYRSGGSWFDAGRPTRLLFEEERSSELMAVESQGTYRFDDAGEYSLRVSGVYGQGCPDCVYGVSVFASSAPAGFTAGTETAPPHWSERKLTRHLGSDWMKQLAARSIPERESASTKVDTGEKAGTAESAAKDATAIAAKDTLPQVVVEGSPNQTKALSLPVVVEGAVEQPGQIDTFSFNVEAGQSLAIELETPKATLPYFNPRIGVVDSQNREVLSNVHRRLSMYNNNAEPQVYLRAVEPKATFKFERDGDYQLQIRDITSRYGSPDFRYRILVRPQIPHVGEIRVLAAERGEGMSPAGSELNQINLRRQAPKKVVLLASYEEGFTGDLSFAFEGLPDGVSALPAMQFTEERAPLEVTQNAEIIAPKQQKTAIVLVASADAPLTREPRRIRLFCQPSLGGKLGTKFHVRDIPLMVITASTPAAGTKTGS
ncbi:MAG: hypothetical protein FJW26_03690 [Acidimicrobiia bacterium]|nr:hypothetical protein [Acidimicrobiia bacterium]